MTEPKTGTLWQMRASEMQVQVLHAGYIRNGLSRETKVPSVTYRSDHDNEVTTRPRAEFLRLFQPL